MCDLNKPMSFVAKAVMTTELEYKGSVTLQDLIEMDYLEEGDVQNQEAVNRALYLYSKDLDGGYFVEREGMNSEGWHLDNASFV
ncbi:hypothetical protein J4N45_10885 [Vibrio sp. SCSIO 43140]|uniref:hypothetical protein n=1 Tax=Vibrio sp. SCSIO 43140 TaxID=2819100 RepID=UPI0020757999|nr:hypothetical protein [Vibrio sp. SCSIO 43140]USD59035.1 hypothetical protein J4N45_10885 [Vibrio sp. SCSIO 43140]